MADKLKLGPLTVDAHECVAPECCRIENHSARMTDGRIAPVVFATVPQMDGPEREIAFWGCAIRVLMSQVAQGMAKRMRLPDAAAATLAAELLQFVLDEGAPGDTERDSVYEIMRAAPVAPAVEADPLDAVRACAREALVAIGRARVLQGSMSQGDRDALGAALDAFDLARARSRAGLAPRAGEGSGNA